MLTVHHSNDLDCLADLLAAKVSAEPLAPLATEIVVVPAMPIARWLSIATADRLGVSANTRFVLPAGYVWALIGRVLPDVPARSPLSAESLFWRIAATLQRIPDGTAFDAVRHYLQGGDLARRFELARVLAEVYERYANYRPHWLLRWMEGADGAPGTHETWQAMLFRALVAEMPALPPVHPSDRFFAELAKETTRRKCLPARLTLFGLSALPPLYLEFFHRLSNFIPVTLYLPNPCREYWGQVVRGRTIGRIALEKPDQAAYFEEGNRLFGSLAQHGRQFFNAVLEHGESGDELFVERDASRLLGRIQRDILDLVEPSERGDPFDISSTDDSIRIDVCHGALREADVLHDRLLGLFSADPTLGPEDILILTPDLDQYGAAIEAVFGAAPARRFIPCALSDRGSLAETRVARTLRRLIEVASGRLEAEAMLALLDLPLVRARFGIEADEIGIIRNWMTGLGIRWGIDGANKAAIGLPPERSTTWQAGFDRLILGAALGGGEAPAEVFRDVVPFDDIEGAGTDLAGRFAAFARRMFALADMLRAPRRVGAWSDGLASALEDFLALEVEDEQDAIALRRQIITLAQFSADARFGEPVMFQPFWTVFMRAIECEPSRGRIRAGGVAIGDLSMGGVVPARVVCLVGLNDELFPRRGAARDFDLMEQHPAPGDPRRRDEDRYAFLMALCAAREHLIITFTGRDARTDTSRPPSVVVTELLDAIRGCARSTTHGGLPGQLIVEHPLQPFSARYGGSLVTYGEEWHPRVTHAPRPFSDGAFAADLTSQKSITLDELTRFWTNPSDYFLRGRMGIALARAEEALAEHEPFGLKQRDAYLARHALVEGALSNQSVSLIRARMQADAILPAGEFGEVLLEQMQRLVEPLVSTVLAAHGSDRERIPLNLDVAGWRLTGIIEVVKDSGRLEWRAGRLRASDRMRAWIRHLVWCIACNDATSTSIIGWDGKRPEHETLRHLDAREAADALAALFIHVETGRSKPLRFFPESSFAFARFLRAEADAERAFEKARIAWYGAEFDQLPPESANPYFALAMRDSPIPLDAEFAELASEVWNPLLACRDE